MQHCSGGMIDQRQRLRRPRPGCNRTPYIPSTTSASETRPDNLPVYPRVRDLWRRQKRITLLCGAAAIGSFWADCFGRYVWISKKNQQKRSSTVGSYLQQTAPHERSACEPLSVKWRKSEVNKWEVRGGDCLASQRRDWQLLSGQNRICSNIIINNNDDDDQSRIRARCIYASAFQQSWLSKTYRDTMKICREEK